MRACMLVLSLLVLAGCGADRADAPAWRPDAGRIDDSDGGDPDGGGADGSDAGGPADGGDANDAGEADAGADGGATDPDAGGLDAGTPFGGECDPVFPGVPTGQWEHSFASPLVTLQGAPNHRVRDVVLSPGESRELRARFTYGAADKDLEDERVELFFRRCPAWESWGVFYTDHDGVVFAMIPGSLPAGNYSVRLLVHGDGSTADGVVAVWPPGTQAIVTDVDGTLTTSDWQAVQDVLLGTDADMYADADTAMNLWHAKGYRLLFLTGRPQVVNRYSREWLRRHGFPRSPVQLTESAEQVMPTESGVRSFKGDRLKELRAKGIEWRAAYGNATTDIGAYADAAIPKADTYIIGPNAGEDATQAIPSYTAHLPVIDAYPDAVQP